MFIIVPMGGVVYYKWVNSVANDTEMIEKQVLNTFINIKLFIIPFSNLYRICMYSKVNLMSF